MARKLAIVISGAVSLGSYESGVMYEVIEAIARHNEKYANNEAERIEIDVIAGASAGAMTASILAQHLICSDDSVRDPYQNPLYRAWVKEVDIRQLLDVEVEGQKFSLLQPEVVDRIGKEYVKDKPSCTQGKHIAAASEIQVAIAMSNLTGYSYEIPIQQAGGEGKFGYTRYKDQFICSVTRSDSGEVVIKEKTFLEGSDGNYWQDFRNSSWQELREASISSGAFPFAFPPKKITRFGEIEDNRDLNAINRFRNRYGDYWYTDGGVFENEPITMARELVEQIDRASASAPQRYYLYVAPGARELPPSPLLKPEGNDFLVIGNALAGSIFQQARFRESIMRKIDAPIFSITAENFLLLGDVFSAFAGFLEEKFRAYDYNIGRELAQESLQNAADRGLLTYDSAKMPQIEWKVKSKIAGQPVTSWQDARGKLLQLAKPPRSNTRNQVMELKELMLEVDVATRREILKQIESRLDSLVTVLSGYVTSNNLLSQAIASILHSAGKIVKAGIFQGWK